MGFFTWLRKRTPSETKRIARRFRPTLEILEDRWLPSTLTVTNNLDSGAGSLRAEIAAARNNDTIVFAPSLDGQTIVLTSGELLIQKNLMIAGPGASQLTISGNQTSRAFELASKYQLNLSGLTISNGDGVFAAGSSYNTNGKGGGIFNSGTLTVSNCVISGNSASIGGGGIFNQGTLTVSSNSVLTGNSSSKYGGGIYNYGFSGVTVTVNNSTLSGNHAVDGGAIWNDYYAAVTLQGGSTLSGNSAFDGAGIFNRSGTVIVSSCTLSSNSASFEGGAIYNAAANYGVPTGTVTIQQNSTLTDNSAARAGAIYNANGGKLTIDGSTLSDNTATYTGGGILDYGWLTVSGSNLTGNSADQAGGGIMLGASYATVTIKNNSSITGNTAPAGFGPDADNLGVLYLDSTSTIGILDGNPATPI
jgi:hypothetical protein